MFFGQRSVPLGQVQLGTGVITSATLVTVISGANALLINPEVQNIRFRDDGTAPTTGIGILVTAGSIYEYTGNIGALQIIGAAGGAICNLSQYKVVG